ncbi:MAG: ABC transporter substrate-binding protein [Acetobacteraceae bacterium]
MRRLIVALCLLAGFVPHPAKSADLAIACSALGVEFRLCRDGVQAWAHATGNRVTIVSTPNAATERLALYQQLLAAGSPDIDVLQIDVIWPATLSRHLADLRPFIDQSTVRRHFPAMIANDTVQGRLVAMPWFAGAGMLYYRNDLLEKYGFHPPRTWDDLTHFANAIQRQERAQGHTRMWGFVFQAKAYEGLTCNALEWIASSGGGTIVAPDGAITVDNPDAAHALTRAAGWVGTIAPTGVLNYAEEDARGVFQSGNAVFMRNWPYAWALGNAEGSPVKDRIGVMPLPAGSGLDGKPAGTLGGAQLAVSRYSRHPGLAAALVRYLTSPDEQKRRAIQGSYNPTIPALYDDPEVLAANPFFATMRDILSHAVARPATVTGTRYNQVSAAVFNAVHDVLSGSRSAPDSLAALHRRLQRLSRGGAW